MSALPDRDRDQRSHPRRTLELPVILSDTKSRVRATLCFDTADLSASGAFLRSDLLFEVKEELHLVFELPGGVHVEARGRVVRVVRDAAAVSGMGIAFTHFTDRDREAIVAFLQRA